MGRNAFLRMGFCVMKTFVKSVFILAIAVLACHTRAADMSPIITGTVRDPSGAPAMGVLVGFHPGSYPGASEYIEVKTDANGRYEIILQKKAPELFFAGHINRTNSIMARDLERNLATIQEYAQTATNIDLTLQPAITLTGSVKNTKGVP